MTTFITPHCISAYVIRLTPEGAFYLLIRRCGKYLTHTWQMISGKIEESETAMEAALREIQEETGLTPSLLYSADAVETFYMQSHDKITFVPVFVAFVEETTVRLSAKEHDAYEWLPFEEAKDRLVWAEQKRVITHIHHCFVLTQPNPLLLIEKPPPLVSLTPTISRTGVYGIALEDRKLLVVKQQKGPLSGKWDLPGGGIEAEETIKEALQREFLEEVGTTFDSMSFFGNITANTRGIDEEGLPYLFHRIGLVYLVDGLSRLSHQTGEMEHEWMDLKELTPETISPFVAQVLDQLKTGP